MDGNGKIRIRDGFNLRLIKQDINQRLNEPQVNGIKYYP